MDELELAFLIAVANVRAARLEIGKERAARHFKPLLLPCRPDFKVDLLGVRRAEVVRRYLSRDGIALNRMSTISYGQDAPVAPNETREGRAQNRRVVVMVLS